MHLQRKHLQVASSIEDQHLHQACGSTRLGVLHLQTLCSVSRGHVLTQPLVPCCLSARDRGRFAYDGSRLAAYSRRGTRDLFRLDHISVIDGHFDAFSITVERFIHLL